MKPLLGMDGMDEVLDFWKIRKARRAAVEIIGPLVERTRLLNGRIDDKVWMSPYMVGFMAMLITLAARRHFASISQDALGNVQQDAWQALTGLSGAMMGQEVCLLSSAGDAEFELGCENAARFMAALAAQQDAAAAGDPDAAFCDAGSGGQFGSGQAGRDIWALWSEYFEGPMPGTGGSS